MLAQITTILLFTTLALARRAPEAGPVELAPETQPMVLAAGPQTGPAIYKAPSPVELDPTALSGENADGTEVYIEGEHGDDDDEFELEPVGDGAADEKQVVGEEVTSGEEVEVAVGEGCGCGEEAEVPVEVVGEEVTGGEVPFEGAGNRKMAPTVWAAVMVGLIGFAAVGMA